MRSLSLKDKIAAGMALNVSELCRATGFGRRKIDRMKPYLPFVHGQIRLETFWRCIENCDHAPCFCGRISCGTVTPRETTAPLEAVNDLPRVESKSDAQGSQSGRRDASRSLGERLVLGIG